MENPFKPEVKYGLKTLALVLFASFFSIAFMAYLDEHFGGLYLAATYGATAALVFASPKARYSRPKNVFFGHLFSAVIGVTLTLVSVELGVYTGYEWIVCGGAVSLSIVVMMLTDTVHPPGGATALTCVLACATSYMYIVRPLMIGIVFIMAVSYLVNHYLRRDAE